MQSIIPRDVLQRLERTVCVVDASRSPQLDPAHQASRRLRVGVLVSVGKLPAWMLTVLERINESPSLELVLIRVESERARQTSASWRYFILNVWKRFDSISFAKENTALRLADTPHELNHVNTLHIAPGLLSDTDLERLKAAQLDVILSLDQDDLIPRLLDTAEHGVWSLCDGHENATAESALWDIVERRDVSPAAIVRHTRTGSEVVYHSVFPWRGIATESVRAGQHSSTRHYSTIPRQLLSKFVASSPSLPRWRCNAACPGISRC